MQTALTRNSDEKALVPASGRAPSSPAARLAIEVLTDPTSKETVRELGFDLQRLDFLRRLSLSDHHSESQPHGARPAGAKLWPPQAGCVLTCCPKEIKAFALKPQLLVQQVVR